MVSSRLSLAAAFSIVASAASVLADISVNQTLSSQLPNIAEVGKSYSWTFTPSTFVTDNIGHLISYRANGLPSWASFDSNTRTFSGTPTENDAGRSQITIVASEEGGDQAQDSFTLVATDEPLPTLNKPLVTQLPIASSLGAQSILANGDQHIPLGWSFSIGFDGDTFSLPNYTSIYYTAQLAGFKPLPSWLQFDQSLTFWGVAPTNPGPEGESFQVVVTASSERGMGGTSDSFTIVVSEHALTLANPLRQVNATAGERMHYTIPTTGLQLDGKQSPPSNRITVSADVSAFSWLVFDATAASLTGEPPFSFAEDDEVSVQVPVRFTDTYKNELAANLTINVYPSAFNTDNIPSALIQSGVPFNVSFLKYVRDGEGRGDEFNLNYDPVTASSWIKYDPESLSVTGTAPTDAGTDRVKILLEAPSDQPGNGTSTATILLALKESALKGNDGSKGGSKGLSNRSKIALAASLGTVGGIIMIVLLMMCCRRCYAKEDHDTQGRTIDYAKQDDERTLTEGKSPMLGFGSPISQKWRRKNMEEASPYLSAGKSPHSLWQGESPNLHQLTEVKFGGQSTSPVMGEALQAYQQAQAVSMANNAPAQEKPRRSALLGFMNKKSKSGRSLVRDATFNSANMARNQLSDHSGASVGLGLQGVGPAESDNPYDANQMGHSRSYARSSWESGLFSEGGEDRSSAGSRMSNNRVGTPVEGLGVISSDSGSPASLPRKRGARGPMRHRNSHINDSPAFNLGNGFDTRTSENLETLAEGQNEHFEDGERGYQLGEAEYDDANGAIVSRARKVSMEKSGTMRPPQAVSIQAGQRNASHHLDTLEDGNEGSEFEDAEDQPGYEDEVTQREQEARQRDSRASYMPGLDGADTSAIRYPEDNLKKLNSMGSEMRPEETMRVIQNSNVPVTPLFQGTDGFGAQHPARSRANSVSRARLGSSAGKETAQRVEAFPGELIRVQALGNQPPPMMGGAPGSPGKRSGRRLNYVPVLQDEKYPEYHDTWPEWLQWLAWDPRMYELSGTVPPRFGPTPLTLRIVIMARSPAPPSPALGSDPTKRPTTHGRTASNDSAFTAVAVEDELVAVVTLHIKSPTSHGVELRRGNAF
ncbi:hypothetical protein IE53DRAFT_244279 [Violaceomyces palustris]|uniref:Uncharacterized protein n=1 Tax=Violaceomyces palustris TaxID=1673888 RepID=A0ACD0NP59_9BASI|nr:hypothetical protein IE53DRAFT_244279 [Violaceomyces palustris]